ncbi:hypothetical protein KIN20_012558 [Parelaphostrongylus tenuis]|uniref:Uncharacterized protein n=1 Tax=Parelaphostrongylus tenuis TaxID=148309 RepID=A0AAD5MFE2_PARTN|nr:hypothetical protein KIN20_012558 [Parelaphostrongylus tenuis]
MRIKSENRLTNTRSILTKGFANLNQETGRGEGGLSGSPRKDETPERYAGSTMSEILVRRDTSMSRTYKNIAVAKRTRARESARGRGESDTESEQRNDA